MAKTQLTIKLKKVLPALPPTPTITLSTNSLGFAATKLGSASNTQVYQVSGADLTAPLIITGNAGYIVNLDDSAADATPITLNPSGGTVPATTVYVKFAPSNYASYPNSIFNSSTGAITKNVACTGNAAMEPVLVTWWTALAVKPNGSTMTAFQKMFKAITDSGNLTKLDLFHFFGGLNDNAQYIKPIISTAGSNFAAVGTVNYGGGISFSGGYLDLKFKPSISGVSFTTNNGTIGVYSRTNVSGNYVDLGSNDATNKIHLKILDGGVMTGIVNHATGVNQSNANSQGFFAAKIEGGTDIKLTNNAATTTLPLTGSPAGVAPALILGARNNNNTPANHSPRTYSCVFVGGDINITDLYNAVLACANELGVN